MLYIKCYFIIKNRSCQEGRAFFYEIGWRLDEKSALDLYFFAMFAYTATVGEAFRLPKNERISLTTLKHVILSRVELFVRE